MRRSTRIGLAVAIILLLALGGVYTAFWFIAAGRIEEGVVQGADALRAQNVDATWQGVRVGGYPLAFRVELSDARLRTTGGNVPAELRAPSLFASTRPWNYRVWQLAAPEGLSVAAGPTEAPVIRVAAHTASGSVVAASDGGVNIWLGLGDATADFGLQMAARQTDLWVNLPPHPPQGHTEPAVAIALGAHEVTLPTVPAPFRNPLDEVAFGTTLMGALPAGPPRRAAEAWRDAGGTLELDHFNLRWGTVAINGSGTLALDPDLQPIGGFSGTVAGYDELMNALVAAGRMRANDARLARLGLAMLAKAGPDGRPEISTSFTIQNGQMYLGPAKLGPVPRIIWQ
jgi:hypothetical protein